MARKSKETEIKEEKNNIEELKNELKEYIDIKIKNGLESEVNNVNKKLISDKNRRLFFKNVIILILLIIVGFLVYILYNENYFSKNKENIIINNGITKEPEKNDEEPKKEEAKLEVLISKYSYLLDKINFSEESEYLSDIYNGNLNSEIKNYLAFNNIDFSLLTKEENYYVFESNLLENEYVKIFSDEIENASFSFNKNKIRYISKLSSYVSDNDINKIESNIKREIIKIKENEGVISITCIEGLLKEDKLYNSITLQEVEGYKNGSIIDFKDELNTITYNFENEKLINIK